MVMSFNYNGSANSTATLEYYNGVCSVSNTANYPWHRIAKIGVITSAYYDASSIL